MTTIRSSVHYLLLLSLLTPLLVFGQESVATSTAVAGDTVQEPWYKIEQLIGNPQVGDFVVGPGRTELSIKPGETKTFTLSVANRISDDRAFKLEVVDINGTPDGSSALQVIEGERGPYSVLDYITFPEDTITLKLGERARLPITVSVPADAEPGGYYGSILVSTVQVSASTETATPRNPIIARVGSHVFLTIEGEQEVGGEVLGISTLPSSWWYETGPITFGISYENTGSLHTNAYGQLSIKNLLNEEVGFVEIEPWFILPKSIRTREIEWNREFLFGRYTAVASINRGYDDIVDEVSVTFWVLPWKLVALLFGGLFIVFLVLRLFFRTFEFKRK